MANLTLAVRAATLKHGDTLYSFDSVTGVPEDTPKPVVDELRRMGAVSEAPKSSGGSSSGASIDVASASVKDIGEHIDSEKLNASETVALAGDDPDLAAKVLEAESLSHGGDGRSTVVEPLEKIRGRK